MNSLKILAFTASVAAFLSAGRLSDIRCSNKANDREVLESNISEQPKITVSKDNKIQFHAFFVSVPV